MLQADTRASMLHKLTFKLSHGSAYGTVHEYLNYRNVWRIWVPK